MIYERNEWRLRKGKIFNYYNDIVIYIEEINN